MGQCLALPYHLEQLLNYHRRLRLISEALELRMEGGHVSRGWCMWVVGHGYGGLVGVGMEVVDGMDAAQGQGGCSHVDGCRGTSQV